MTYALELLASMKIVTQQQKFDTINWEMASNTQDNGNLEAARRQVDEVQNIMKQNVDKVLERDGKLSQLEDRADRLQEGTEQFHRLVNWAYKVILGLIGTYVTYSAHPSILCHL